MGIIFEKTRYVAQYWLTEVKLSLRCRVSCFVIHAAAKRSDYWLPLYFMNHYAILSTVATGDEANSKPISASAGGS